MKIRSLTVAPSAVLGNALEAFEHQFVYPLGPGNQFRISHGLRYLPFFEAIGEPAVIVAEREGEVLGTLAFVRRLLEGPEKERMLAHYLCDLKVAPVARGSSVLARLIREAKRQIEPAESHVCYSVVMDGTGQLPTDYTGRLGVPAFSKVGEIVVLRLPASLALAGGEATSGQYEEARRGIARTGYTATGGKSGTRSRMRPVALVGAGGLACGTVEDTRLGKVLIAGDGTEMLSAHLSGFAYATPEAGADLLCRAVAVAAANGMPALFAAVPRGEFLRLMSYLGGAEIVQAPATVFGYDLTAGRDWWVDTAEI